MKSQNTIESDGTAFDVNNKRYEKCFLLPFKNKTYLDQNTISLFIFLSKIMWLVALNFHI